MGRAGGFGRLTFPGRATTVGCHDRTVSEAHLDAMVADPQADLEPERLGQPVGGGVHVAVGELRDDRRRRNGSVVDHSHDSNLSLVTGPRRRISVSLMGLGFVDLGHRCFGVLIGRIRPR